MTREEIWLQEFLADYQFRSLIELFEISLSDVRSDIIDCADRIEIHGSDDGEVLYQLEKMEKLIFLYRYLSKK